MNMKTGIRAILLALAAALVLAACGEREQTINPVSEKRYQGKNDGKPWDNDPLAYQGAAPSPTWAKGDQASWEKQIETRARRQNENTRIGQ